MVMTLIFSFNGVMLVSVSCRLLCICEMIMVMMNGILTFLTRCTLLLLTLILSTNMDSGSSCAGAASPTVDVHNDSGTCPAAGVVRMG